jgi:hypothetical protein
MGDTAFMLTLRTDEDFFDFRHRQSFQPCGLMSYKQSSVPLVSGEEYEYRVYAEMIRVTDMLFLLLGSDPR